VAGVLLYWESDDSLTGFAGSGRMTRRGNVCKGLLVRGEIRTLRYEKHQMNYINKHKLN